ncbi:MAG: YceI family protein [Variovorax sp.]|nr:YceI family protein [Variovorax sp.]
MKKALVIAALLLGALPLHRTFAADWTSEPSDSRLAFAAVFEKTPAPGVFREFEVRLRLDPDQAEASRLDVTINIASADMSNADINKAIAGADWFDFARFGRAEFHASGIRRVQADAFVARGTLTLKGVQRPVEVPFSWSESQGSATMEGKFVVQRGAFGIGTGEWSATDVIGADVTVSFRVRLRRAS